MTLSRRQFTAAAGTTFALTVLGCGDDGSDANSNPDADIETPKHPGDEPKDTAKIPDKIDIPTEPFLVGEPAEYDRIGIFDEYFLDTGVYLFVNAENRLYAISSTCTHNGCAVQWKAADKRFTCPCHESEFETDGFIPRDLNGQKAKEPLFRYGVRVVELENGTFIEVDPAMEYFEGEWDDPKCFIDLAEV